MLGSMTAGQLNERAMLAGRERGGEYHQEAGDYHLHVIGLIKAGRGGMQHGLADVHTLRVAAASSCCLLKSASAPAARRVAA